MNTSQALGRLRKLLGKDAAIQDSKEATSEAIREGLRAARRDAVAAKQAAEIAMTTRKQALLDADAEFQRARAAYLSAKEALEKMRWPERYRYSAGKLHTTAGLNYFALEAQADNLTELVAAVEAKRAAA